eukprot:5247003-Pleurochrysis_carterae.AAC.1
MQQGVRIAEQCQSLGKEGEGRKGRVGRNEKAVKKIGEVRIRVGRRKPGKPGSRRQEQTWEVNSIMLHITHLRPRLPNGNSGYSILKRVNNTTNTQSLRPFLKLKEEDNGRQCTVREKTMIALMIRLGGTRATYELMNIAMTFICIRDDFHLALATDGSREWEIEYEKRSLTQQKRHTRCLKG